MSSVSTSSGAGVDSGGDRNQRKPKSCIERVFGSSNFKTSDNSKLKVPNKSATRFLRRKHTNLLVCLVLPVTLCVLCSFPDGCHAGKAKKDTGSKNGNFSQSPTNHEEVLSRKKESFSTADTEDDNDDYWVGSHKLEFKPHPLLMPSTQTPSAQIPIPIIELGLPPTTISPSSLSSGERFGGEVEDLSESASTASEDEVKEPTKARKGRVGRKKSRDQRRMAHRTLWQKQMAASNNSNHMMRPFHQNPHFLHNHHQMQNQQSPVILTAGSMMMGSQSPLLIPPLNNRNGHDESFHGSATTWNINHPGNGIIAPNMIQSYPSSQSGPHGGPTSSSSQETSQHQPPPFSPGSSSFPQYQFNYPQFHQTHQQQQLRLASQFSPQQSQQIPLQIPPLAQHTYSMGPSGPEYLSQQSGSTPVIVGSNNGPVLMYVGPGGIPSQVGNGLMPSASGPVPVKPFNINEIPGVGLPYPLQHNHITGPDISGAQHHPAPLHQQNGGGNNNNGGGSSNNPQYLRNNFLRMVMDKMANVGRLLPIPFVTKYAYPPGQSPQQQQGYNRHNHFSRRMKK